MRHTLFKLTCDGRLKYGATCTSWTQGLLRSIALLLRPRVLSRVRVVDSTVYVDPPYVAASRVSLSQYRLEAADDDFHERLAAALNDCKASVVLSGYDSTAYDDLYPGWHRVEMKAPPSLGASARTEVLWSNRPIGTPDLFSFDAEASA